jgi:hypothetical protein
MINNNKTQWAKGFGLVMLQKNSSPHRNLGQWTQNTIGSFLWSEMHNSSGQNKSAKTDHRKAGENE